MVLALRLMSVESFRIRTGENTWLMQVSCVQIVMDVLLVLKFSRHVPFPTIFVHMYCFRVQCLLQAIPQTTARQPNPIYPREPRQNPQWSAITPSQALASLPDQQTFLTAPHSSRTVRASCTC